MSKQKRQKILVAMSGGVDSSAAAALLQRAGFSVQGLYFRFWQETLQGMLPCKVYRGASPVANVANTGEERAKQATQALGVPLHLVDLRKDFKKVVVDYFLAEYKAGRTPNPCVVCNKEIKFKFLIKKALELDCDYIATGHYARKAPMDLTNITAARNVKCKHKLLRAIDRTKDQSYFLWQVGQKELSYLLFPIGDYTKQQVRTLAKKFGLPTAQTKESQEVCFIRKTTTDFLKKCLQEKPGPIVDKSGRQIGQHQGLWFYTIGQRKGINLSGGPYYVIDKDIKKNALVISQNKKDLEKKELFCKNVNWLAGKPPKNITGIKAKIRYGSKSAVVKSVQKITSQKYQVVFEKAQRAITPGQSIVFYLNQQLFGGGIIC